jgi:hypothetical protein
LCWEKVVFDFNASENDSAPFESINSFLFIHHSYKFKYSIYKTQITTKQFIHFRIKSNQIKSE